MSATPGPWRAVNRSSDGADDPFLGWDVEGPPPAERGMFQRREDAYLTAAAPELLEALEEATDTLAMQLNFHRMPGQPWEPDDEEAAQRIDRLRDLIDNAKGLRA